MVRLPKSASLERACSRNDRCGVSIVVPFSFQSLSICSWGSAVLSQPPVSLQLSLLYPFLDISLYFGYPEDKTVEGPVKVLQIDL